MKQSELRSYVVICPTPIHGTQTVYNSIVIFRLMARDLTHAQAKLPILFRELQPGEELLSWQDWQADERFLRECLNHPMSDSQLFGQ